MPLCIRGYMQVFSCANVCDDECLCNIVCVCHVIVSVRLCRNMYFLHFCVCVRGALRTWQHVSGVL